MKNLKKIDRQLLKQIKGSSLYFCLEGPYGPELPKSCEDYHLLSEDCKRRVDAHADCFI